MLLSSVMANLAWFTPPNIERNGAEAAASETTYAISFAVYRRNGSPRDRH